ncbi:DUF488 family protein [uncultured Sphingomonas sp.]|uniref:DUF488 domain-containing protein n=1 Tax=uncultured Sphingomonas sp. TaxID=158754 RepID=UPI0035C9D4F4
MIKIFTIGYEGASLADFVVTLTSVGVEIVVDVRDLPQSRRPGFSKKPLTLALAEANIAYQHMKQLGDPKPGRDAARAGQMDTFRSIFTAHMERPASLEQLRELAALVETKSAVLLCYERNPCDCHRKLLCDGLHKLGSFQVEHLGVRPRARGERIDVVGTIRHAGAR